jgi:hypothetical protein
MQPFQYEVTMMTKPGLAHLKWALSAISAAAATVFVLALEGQR